MCIQNLDISHQIDGILPILLKFKLVPSGYIMNNSRMPKEKVQKHTKHHKILCFTIKPCIPSQLWQGPLQHCTQCTYENSLSFFFSADISVEELFLHRLQHCNTVLLKTSQTPLSSDQLGNSSSNMNSICHVSPTSRRK